MMMMMTIQIFPGALPPSTSDSGVLSILGINIIIKNIIIIILIIIPLLLLLLIIIIYSSICDLVLTALSPFSNLFLKNLI